MRDALLGRAEGDRDWVVVGATPEQMIARGYMPVGRDFPVFLHPQTQEEYALARTERKTAPGYHGFVFHAAPDVTLEQDLARRDLTINAMARATDGHADRSVRRRARPAPTACCATCPTPSPKTRCASCAWRASRRACHDFTVAPARRWR